LIISVRRDKTKIGSTSITDLAGGDITRTDSIALEATAADGTYDICTHFAEEESGIYYFRSQGGALIVDNTSPLVDIISPEEGAEVWGSVKVEAIIEDLNLHRASVIIDGEAYPLAAPSITEPQMVAASWHRPSFIQDRDGEFWVAYLSGGGGIAVRHSPDGKEWSEETQAVEGRPLGTSWWSLIQNSNGRYWIALDGDVGIDRYILVTSSSDGLSWTGPKTATPLDVYSMSRLSLIQDSKGRYWIAYLDGQPKQVRVISSLDGDSWSAPTAVVSEPEQVAYATTIDYPSLIQDSSGRYLITYSWGYEETRVTTSLNGITWSAPVSINVPGAKVTGPTSFLQDAQGRYWIIYHMRHRGAFYVFGSYSYDLSKWSQPFQLTFLAGSQWPSGIQSADGTYWTAFVSANNVYVSSSEIFWGYQWDTTAELEGKHDIKLEATDRAGNVGSGSLTVTVVWPVAGDADRDYDVDIFDLVAVATAFNTKVGEQSYNPKADLNRDGIIDVYDLLKVGIHFGKVEYVQAP